MRPWGRGVDRVRGPYRRLTLLALRAAKKGCAREAASVLTRYFYGEIGEKEAIKELRSLLGRSRMRPRGAAHGEACAIGG